MWMMLELPFMNWVNRRSFFKKKGLNRGEMFTETGASLKISLDFDSMVRLQISEME